MKSWLEVVVGGGHVARMVSPSDCVDVVRLHVTMSWWMHSSAGTSAANSAVVLSLGGWRSCGIGCSETIHDMPQSAWCEGEEGNVRTQTVTWR